MGIFFRFFIFATLLLNVFTLNAFAHDSLQKSNPIQNSVISSMPNQIELTFNNNVLTMGAEILVFSDSDSKENSLTEGLPQYNGRQVIQKLKNNINNEDNYNIVWRVVSSDGHPIGGNIKFSVNHKASINNQENINEINTSPSKEWLWIFVIGFSFLIVCITILWLQYNKYKIKK